MAALALGGAALLLAGSTTAMLAGVEPFATWYYLFAWGSTLVALDAASRLAGGELLLLDRPARFLSLAAWSVPFWLFFEFYNFRLENWYYVFVPESPATRWIGIVLSFATVLPAIFAAEHLLASLGLGRGMRRGASGARSRSQLALIQAAGLTMLILPLAWPRYFFPLVWGGVTLLVDPWVYRRARQRSLLGDLDRGRPGRIVRLLTGGMAIGLLWELFNVAARGKWIYTVPGLENLKLFEMPLLGFFGFPVFALEGFAIYQALVVAGLAVAPEEVAGAGSRERSSSRQAGARSAAVGAAIGAAMFAWLVLAGMERETISSTRPRQEVFDRAATDPAARLAVLGGIGTENAARLRSAGIDTVAELAAADPSRLALRLPPDESGAIYPARIRAWVRAARQSEP